MNHHDPDFIARSATAFCDERPPTMADIRDAALADPSLDATRRRDLHSGFKRFEEFCGTPLDQVEAHPRRVREIFGSANAARLPISQKTLSNIRSIVVSALEDYGPAPRRLTRRFPLASAWQDLLAMIETDFQRTALSRLGAFCSRMGIAPDEVRVETLLGLYAALEAEEAVKDPRMVLKNTISNWNRSMRQIPQWPRIVLSSPFKRDGVMRPLCDFPRSFQDEVASWELAMLAPDLMDEDAPARPLRPVTVEHRVLNFRLFASALVEAQHLPIEAVTGIGVLVCPDNFKIALEVIYRRRGKTQSLHNLARSMRLVAKHHCRLPQADLDRLERADSSPILMRVA